MYDPWVGYDGNQGPLTNIDMSGFGRMAFRSCPDMLMWDPYSDDYGLNFSGNVTGAASYVADYLIFGWISFGWNLQSDANRWEIVMPIAKFETYPEHLAPNACLTVLMTP